MMRYKCVFIAIVLTSVVPVNAQFSGRLAGRVVDQSGAAVPGATVELFISGGKKAVLSTKSENDGGYHFLSVRSTRYDLTVAAQGFLKTTLRGVIVDPARETTVPDVRLEVATVTQTIDVTADTQSVQTANAEISSTVTMQEIHKLPAVDRDPLALIQSQPGVVFNGNSDTVIDGQRTSYSNMTLDGINVQDNYIRDNALDYTPNKLLLGQVHEMTLVTSNANAAASGGSSQLAFVTPSGTDEFHGEALWYNRNNYFSGNDWFNNQSGVDRPFLNQNQMGGSLGGPIQKDRLFFYSNYEAVRTRAQTPQTETVLTPDARNGIFTYQNTGGTIRQVNLLTLRGITIDPVMQGLLQQVPTTINSYEVGDSTPGALRNTAGYRFNQRDNETRDNVTGKIDFNLSTKNVLSGSYLWDRDNADRPDAENDFALIPKVTNPTHANLLSLAWRTTPSAHLTNELRGGFDLTYSYFLTSQDFGGYMLTGMIYSDPVNEFLPQGRTTNTYTVADNVGYQHGRHYIQFGFETQQIRVREYDAAGTVTDFSLFMGTGQPALETRDLPGIRSADLDNANALLASLGGYIDSYSQTQNVTSRSSGFVPGAPYVRHFLLNDYALYAQDNWKVRPGLTVTLGLRYELPGVADEVDSLELQPVLQGTAAQTLLSNATLDYSGGSVGKPWYRRDYHDFGPNVGLAWDVFGNGKTAVRAGYSISYVNDQNLVAPENMLVANAGLQGIASDIGLSNRVSTGLPQVIAPDFQMPLTVADNYLNNPFNTAGLIDPDLRTPYVQEWSVGIQHEFRHVIFEARYVGNHAVGAYRAFDFNQVNINAGGFLADFLRAQNNGQLAFNLNGTFNPAYNSSIPGSQPLTVFPKLVQGGFLADATVRNLIQEGQVADLATTYQEDGDNGPISFFTNPNAEGTDLLTNYSSSSYNSLQLEVRHRTESGLDFQANYTFSKVLSDADGDEQSRIQHFLDINNPKIERSRANFDLTQAIKGSVVYDLPIGAGHALHYKPLQRLIGGWSLGGILTWQSGAPFSILSGRGTFNRSSNTRSYYNTADTALTGSQLASIVNFQMTGSGPYIIAQPAINPNDGTGVNGDGEAPFQGQVFFNPGAGTIGTLQRRYFSGPWTFDLDMSIQKTVAITERQSVEVRMEGTNVLNHSTFWAGDQSINSTSFGVMGSTFYGPRVMQFGLYYRF